MPNKRTGYAPWSLTREAGVQSATVEGTIEVSQNVQPTLSTGFVDEKGNWQGTKSNDEVFKKLAKEEAIPNGGEILAPGGNTPFIDMTGFNSLQIAIKPSNGGNFALSAVMGPDTEPYANLRPVNPATTLRGTNDQSYPPSAAKMNDLFYDDAEALTADVWNIYMIMGRLANQRLMQFKITNNSGGSSDIEYGFMRLV